MSSQPCPKCGGTLERGFVPDISYGTVLVGNWHEGEPTRSFWTGGAKRPETPGIPIGVFRCSGCGYLEFFANATFGLKR